MRKRLASLGREYSLSALSVVTVVIAWEVSVHLFNIPSYLLPAPARIVTRLLTTPTLMYHTWITWQEILLGFLVGASVALNLAAAMTRFKLLGKLFYPLIIASQSFPKEALAPLFLIWLGYGILPKIIIAALISFFPVTINTIRGLTSVDPLAIDLMRSMAASEKSIFIKLRVPNALPYILAGLKVAVVLSVVGAIVGEFVGASAGLGHVMLVANAQLATDLFFAALLILGTTGMILFLIVDFIEQRVLYWAAEDPKSQGDKL